MLNLDVVVARYYTLVTCH